MPACTLDVGSRRVLVSEEGPPAAEFALFDASDIELAPVEGGTLREIGYRSTAAEASRRLAVAGVTVDFAVECAKIIRGRVAEAYARGPFVQRLAGLLGPAELFDGGTYDSSLRRYDGTWLDLPLLANDAGIASSTGVLHAAALAMLLHEVPGDTAVVLTTLGHAESLRLGERTLRRQAVEKASSVPRALRHLAEHPPRPHAAGRGPGREELAAKVASRLAACKNDEAREHLVRLERALSERGRPAQGPLSDPDLWEIERLLGTGDTAAAQRALDLREGSRGREPGTVYLRARLALTLGNESPRAIAQRAAELAVSMSDFPEVELLAAQAWNVAGETRNALPFARDLALNPRAPDNLRAAAEAIFRSPRVPLEPVMSSRDFESLEGELRSISHAPPPSSERPRALDPFPSAEPAIRPAPEPTASPYARSVPPPQVVVHDVPGDPFPTPTNEDSERRTLTPPGVAPPPKSVPPVALREQRRYLTPPERMSSPLPPRTSGRDHPAVREELPATDRATRITDAPPARKPPSGAPHSAPPTPRSPGTVPPPSGPPRPSGPPPRPSASGRVVQAVPWPSSLRAPREDRTRPEDIEHTPAQSTSQRLMRGASMPPSRSEPPSRIPRAPVVPRVDIDEADLIETLPLPRGASEAPVETSSFPATALEARIRFTIDARELARRYRRDEGIELRLEARTLLAMQRRLALVFERRVVRTPDEAREAELHGALLSELLARLLDAEWVDVAPTELGYWAMVVPTKGGGGKRVWPFGRILRLIATGGDDDLVAFFKKLRELG